MEKGFDTGAPRVGVEGSNGAAGHGGVVLLYSVPQSVARPSADRAQKVEAKSAAVTLLSFLRTLTCDSDRPRAPCVYSPHSYVSSAGVVYLGRRSGFPTMNLATIVWSTSVVGCCRTCAATVGTSASTTSRT